MLDNGHIADAAHICTIRSECVMDVVQLWLLGRRSGYGGGSWGMQVLPSELDDMWHKVASKTETGLLGGGAQVSGNVDVCWL